MPGYREPAEGGETNEDADKEAALNEVIRAVRDLDYEERRCVLRAVAAFYDILVVSPDDEVPEDA